MNTIWYSRFVSLNTSFWGQFYGSDDPTNNVIALKDDSMNTQTVGVLVKWTGSQILIEVLVNNTACHC